MHFFRLLHRRTKSEADVASLARQTLAGVVAPVFVPFQQSIPSFDPTHELYDASCTDSVQTWIDPNTIDKLNAKIIELEAQLVHLQDERSSLEQDIGDYRADLLHTRTDLYSEMLRSARHEQRAMDNFRTIQNLEAKNQRFCSLLVDVGIPRPTVDLIYQAIQSGNGSPDDILVNAIKDAANDDNTLLARLKPIIKSERTHEHYQAALNMTLSIRKELKSQEKRTKFWKKLAQQDGRRGDTLTPSPSNISSICQDFSPERQNALDALIARRRAAKRSESKEVGVFGGQQTKSALDALASSLASGPRRSIPEDLRLSSSVSSSTSSASTYASYISGPSRVPRDSTTEAPTIPSHLPFSLSTSHRLSSRHSTQSLVLGSINLNVSSSSPVDPTLPEETERHANPETGPVSMVTFSQDLLQNSRRAPEGNGRRRSSTTSRRPAPRSTRSSFRLSTFSPIRTSRPSWSLIGPDSDILGNMAIDAPSFDTPGLSELATNTDMDTPASSDVTRGTDTPFNDARVLSKYGSDTPFSPTELDAQVTSTPLDGSVASKPLNGMVFPQDTRFLEHLDCDVSLSTSISVFASDSSACAQYGCDTRHDHESDEDDDRHLRDIDSGDTIPVGESKDSLCTTSASSFSASDTPAPSTPPTPSPSTAPDVGDGSPMSGDSGGGAGARKASIGRNMFPVLAKHLRRLSLSGSSPDRGRLVDKLRGLRSLSKSRSKSRSRSRSGSGSGSGSLAVSGTTSPPFARVWRGSPTRSDSSKSDQLTASPSPSPMKGSGIPILRRQRRMTIRARRMSVRKG